LNKEDAISLGVTGSVLSASGATKSTRENPNTNHPHLTVKVVLHIWDGTICSLSLRGAQATEPSSII